MTRILVVDDHPTQAEEFGDLLRNAGCDVTLAGNGREAMDLLRLDLPDIVLTDLDMPVMDGLELVQAIRREYPALPVILMTAMGSEGPAPGRGGLRPQAEPGPGGRPDRGERPGRGPRPPPAGAGVRLPDGWP